MISDKLSKSLRLETDKFNAAAGKDYGKLDNILKLFTIKIAIDDIQYNQKDHIFTLTIDGYVVGISITNYWNHILYVNTYHPVIQCNVDDIFIKEVEEFLIKEKDKQTAKTKGEK